MTRLITRRTFIKSGAALGAASTIGVPTGWLGRTALAAGPTDIVAVKGTNYFQSALKAIELMGGMGKFVPKQSKVGLLVNSPMDNPGTYVKPEITLAAARMCFEAGAKEVGLIKPTGRSYWRRGELSKELRDEARRLRDYSGDFKTVPIKNGKSLKEAEVAKRLLDCDVYINIPIAKHHDGVLFTGAIKNLMGSLSQTTTRFFHFSNGASGYYDDVEFLSQCIADVNLVRKPDLCLFDATVMITANGPFGPGKLTKPQVVFAGLDRVASDVYGANLLGAKGEEILPIRKAHEHGLGEIDLGRQRIREITL